MGAPVFSLIYTFLPEASPEASLCTSFWRRSSPCLSFPHSSILTNFFFLPSLKTEHRAREFKFALELKPSHKVCRTYAAAGVDNGVDGWGVGTVLYGSVKEWVCQGRKGLRKFRNFEALRREDRFDLTDYVFVGDTGELDLQAGESMIR